MEFEYSKNVKDVKPSAIREIFKSLSVPGMISFAAGNPSPESFPASDMRRIADGIFASAASEALQYGTTEGYLPLRGQIEARLKQKFSSCSDGDSVIVTTGGQQGIDLISRVLIDPGDTVVCEDPTFIGALNSFRVCGAKTVGVPMDSDGINTDKLEKVLSDNPRCKLLYLIPTFQNPSGVTCSAEKRREIYRIAASHGVVILEDNPYGELRFSGEDVPTFKSIDTEGIVAYCSSFSKILSSGMRVGFLCGPKALIERAVVVKQANDVHTNLFFQMLVSRYMSECDLDSHIESIRDLYRRKCELMVSELARQLPPEVTFTRPQGGLFLWLTLPRGDSSEFFRLCMDRTVAVVDGKTFQPSPAPCRSVRLNYSTPSDEQIITGVSRLAAAAAEYIGS